MDPNLITNLSTCMPAVLSELNGSLSILYYSHIPIIIVSLLLGIFILINSGKSVLSRIFFYLSLLFAIWSVLDLFTWLSTDTRIIMFAWAPTGLIEALFYVLSLYFVYVFITKNDASLKQKILWGIILLPLMVMIPLKLNLSGFSSDGCNALESNYSLYYKYFVEIISAITILIFSIVKISRESDKILRKQILLLLTGISLFLLSFFSAVFLSSYLADKGILSGFVFEVYGLFGTLIFMSSLVFLIVRFKAFDIKLIGSQALVWTLIIIIGSEFFFIQNNTNRVLTAITLVISAITGIMIVRSVKKEVALREELQVANDNQQLLIRFITHQVKGFFTKSKMIFASALEGDLGEMNEPMKDMMKIGLESDNKAVDMVQEVLKASSLRTGEMTYNFEETSAVDFVKEIAEGFRKTAEEKGLQYGVNLPMDNIKFKIDKLQMTQVIKNLIDNSVKYTLKGSVKVSLKVSKPNILFTIHDTGVGLSDADKAKLFKEGGRGEESLKVNVNSTGYGLFIVKKIVEGHGGKIWAESAGRGHGSRFCVELPVAA